MMIKGYVQIRRLDDALNLFYEMPEKDTFGEVEMAERLFREMPVRDVIHGQIVKLGYCFDEFVAASLITLYANCKQTENLYRVFRDMMNSGVLPNQSSFTSALNSCCGLEDLDQGKETQTAAVNVGFETDVFVANALIVFYTKCGSMNGGVSVFKRIGDKNIVSGNSTKVGCAQHGCGIHSGMLQKARHFLKFFSVEVKLEHYACMVDVLGRCGELEEAEELIKNMPVQANKKVWLTLLSACTMHCNFDVAERAARRIEDFDPHCSAVYVLLSNLYASANRWSDVSRIREKMRHSRTGKQPGRSWVTQ
ncbi:pentatricopeptide repeat-containing protein At5g46460, mitochondrial-like [Pyrus x bretschneideri]|uniref:pentatricopeptide repeat-containing protein At5g46460, mitochondrial-like n=1 Tax=Pyrus x bretschneideri TaxID=225117 RepID=UPI002030FF04|nr:pentatricopeptide repeat-containing protein At5g46460, mitochondrial-like [Pyrus x bretschneideri]